MRHAIDVQLLATRFAALTVERESWKPAFDLSAPQLRFALDKNALRTRAAFLLDLVSDVPESLCLAFCDAPMMAEANARFRRKRYPTDVLSFPTASGFADPGQSHRHALGEILICLPVCLRQATRGRRTPARELERMLVHGIAHLKGFDHERGDAAFRVMTALERGIARELERAHGAPAWAEVRGHGK